MSDQFKNVGQDVEIALRTSGNALDENFLPMILGAAYGAYKIYSVIQVGCEAYDAYQKAGRGEAGRDEALKILIKEGAIAIAVGRGIKGTTYLLGNGRAYFGRSGMGCLCRQDALPQKTAGRGIPRYREDQESAKKGIRRPQRQNPQRRDSGF